MHARCVPVVQPDTWHISNLVEHSRQTASCGLDVPVLKRKDGIVAALSANLGRTRFIVGHLIIIFVFFLFQVRSRFEGMDAVIGRCMQGVFQLYSAPS